MNALSGSALIGDIGGTNARLALIDLKTGVMSDPIIYSAVDNPSLESVIRRFRDECGASFKEACIAIACPITGDHVKMTNNPWEFSIAEMKRSLGLETLLIINDFTAMSMSVPVLPKESMIKLGGGEVDRSKPAAIYGAGTGLGVGHLVRIGKKWIPFPGEGGHVDMAPASVTEDLILIALRGKIGHVSYERVLSGPGLVNLYEAIAMRNMHEPKQLTPADVTAGGLRIPAEPDCLEALHTFCRIMGSFGGNLALNLDTKGGVYIAGGVVTHMLDFFIQSEFRQSFEYKGRMKPLLEKIPVYVITDPLAGLKGAGAMLRQELGAEL